MTHTIWNINFTKKIPKHFPASNGNCYKSVENRPPTIYPFCGGSYFFLGFWPILLNFSVKIYNFIEIVLANNKKQKPVLEMYWQNKFNENVIGIGIVRQKARIGKTCGKCYTLPSMVCQKCLIELSWTKEKQDKTWLTFYCSLLHQLSSFFYIKTFNK